MASVIRSSDDFYDPFGFVQALDELSISVLLNPIHDYMRRYEMKKKRAHYSKNGRTVISIWNRGKGREPDLPWTVFHDGCEATSSVRELPKVIAERADIRVGITDIRKF